MHTYVHICCCCFIRRYFLHVLILILMSLVLAATVKVPINLEEAIVGACRMLELEPTLSFQSNVIQFIQLVQAHKMVSAYLRSNPSYCCTVLQHCMHVIQWSSSQIVVAGPPCCGKTACATVGAEALRLLGYSVLYTKVNLNQGPQSSLTGTWDTTRCVLSTTYSTVCMYMLYILCVQAYFMYLCNMCNLYQVHFYFLYVCHRL